ncbi:MAG: ClC family H(+)/Cl(-) exchange transporter [Coriobacteriales bacterium]|nr:ClC family H(+)/Cl(-) exchange transporter [Coriobacteriales bacterium]
MAMVAEGILVGLLAGGVITLYRLALSNAEHLLRSITALASHSILGMMGWALVLLALCLVVCFLVRWEPNTAGSGIPQVDAEVMDRLDMPWHRVIVAKFIEGTLCAFAGLSLGREGPSVQLGGVSGKAVSRILKKDRGEERILVTCGAAAGMSAAFHAPLAGVLFAVEEIHREFTAPLVISAMTASLSADFLVSQILGVQPVLSFSFTHDVAHAHYGLLLLFGALCGLLGALHNAGMFACQEHLFDRLKGYLPFSRYVIPFIIAWFAAFWFPDLMCGGDAIVERMLSPEGLTIGSALMLLVGKYLYTTICFGSGAPGGTLFPLVILGSLAGLIFGMATVALPNIPDGYVANFMVLGIAGLFAGAIRAPVSAVVLCFELTGTLDALLAVSIVSITSYVVANLTHVEPFYEVGLGRLIEVTPDDPTVNGAGDRLLHTYHVAAGSMVEGRLVSEVPWPNGALLVNISRAGSNIIPTGKVQLMALDEILVTMNADTDWDTDLIIHKLCEGRV